MDHFNPDDIIAETPDGEQISRARALDDIEKYMSEMADTWQEMAAKFTEAKDSDSGVSGMAVAMSFEMVHDATHELRNLLAILGQSEIKAMIRGVATGQPAVPFDIETEVKQIPDTFNPEDWA